MSRAYLNQDRVAAVAEQLTDREWQIALSLQKIKAATGLQIERLHFGLDGPGTSARNRRRVLTRLVTLGVLSRLERRIGGVRAGSSGFVYGLDRVGQRILDTKEGSGRWRRPFTPGMAFLQHRLAITEIHVRLEEAGRAGVLEPIEFAAEPDCWRSFSGRGGGRVLLKPDAYARVGSEGYEYLWFVEVDRAAESRPALKIKCQRYIDYWLSGREDTRSAVFPAVLWLVPDERRVDALVDVIGHLPTDGRRLFQVGIFDQAVDIMGGRRHADPAA